MRHFEHHLTGLYVRGRKHFPDVENRAAGDAGLLEQPLLTDSRSDAATEAVQCRVRVVPEEGAPCTDASPLDLTTDQFFTECDGLVLTLLGVRQPDSVALLVVHQRVVLGGREGAVGEFDWRPDVDQWRVLEKQAAEIVDLRECAGGHAVGLLQRLATAGAGGEPAGARQAKRIIYRCASG